MELIQTCLFKASPCWFYNFSKYTRKTTGGNKNTGYVTIEEKI